MPEEFFECIETVQRQYLRHVLIRPNDHNASCLSVNATQIIDILAGTLVCAEDFFIVLQPQFAFAGAQGLWHVGYLRLMVMRL